jgi:serine/threonine-protein kinase
MESSSGRLRRTAEVSTEKYRILAELGEGGMANVYLAVARGPGGFNKLLVLKAIREDLALQPDLLAMFLDEARLAARLSHPNVVQTIEVSELRGRPVIVMEYLDGQPLSTILHRPECRDMTLGMRLRTVSAALDGLQYIHDLADFDGTPLQLVHRDVSPHNVFVTFDGQVKLLDFGIAKGLISRARTSTDVIKGKIRYMAPEQMCGEAVDRRADIFSAGVILWEIATSRRIWHGRSEVNVMHAVLNEGVPPPNTVEPTVAPELNEICMRALARAPGDRFQTAGDFQTALEGYLERMGSRVSQKEIGKYLAKAFAENRARTREVIEAELKKSEADTAETSSGRFAFPAQLVSLSNGAESGSVEPVVAPQTPRRGWAALAAALAAGAIVSGVLIFHKPSQGAGSQPSASTAADTLMTAAAPAPPTVDPAATASVAPVHTVQVQLSTAPASAALFFDGKRIDNPFSGSYPADPLKHSLRAEAPGYISATSDIVLDRDVKLVLPLAMAKTAGNLRHQPATTAPAAPQTPAAPSPPAPPTNNSNCTPPFYFDAQGIKRLKPECL